MKVIMTVPHYDAGFALPMTEPEGCEVRSLQGEGESMVIKPDPNTQPDSQQNY